LSRITPFYGISKPSGQNQFPKTQSILNFCRPSTKTQSIPDQPNSNQKDSPTFKIIAEITEISAKKKIHEKFLD
jgi:hypothetical protein